MPANSLLLFSRIRKFSLNFLGPDEDRPFINQTNESFSNPLNQPLPDIIIEPSEGSAVHESLELHPQTSSISSDKNDDTRL